MAAIALAAAIAGMYLARSLNQPALVQLESGTALPVPGALTPFDLVDTRGAPIAPAQLQGHPTLVFFGFTYCPDVCPTTLARLAEAAKVAAPKGLRIAFVTVDPARDTTSQLAEYVHAFGPRVTGLRATEGELEDAARRYRVGYTRGKPDARGEYEVMHSSGVFAFDGEGRARLIILPGASESDMVAALRRLAAESRA